MRQVLIVEDVAETRRWLTTIASAAFLGCNVIATDSVRGAMAELGRNPAFDIAMIDLRLPDGNGLEVLQRIAASGAATLSVVTTVLGDDANIVAALSGGAAGYLLKEQPQDQIIKQLTQLSEGVPALSPSVARRIMEHFRNTGPVAEDVTLTARECEVLALISRGLRNVDVARQLALSENTVASHLKSIYRKLGISSRAEASWHATRLGLSPGR